MTVQLIINGSALTSTFVRQFDEKEKQIIAMFNHYSAEIIKYFMMVQGRNGFWTNRTFALIRSFYAQTLERKGELVLQFGYTGEAKNKYTKEEYAKYIEYDYDGRFAALPTILDRFADLLLKDLKRLYGDAS